MSLHAELPGVRAAVLRREQARRNVVPLNPSYREPELTYQINAAGACRLSD